MPGAKPSIVLGRRHEMVHDEPFIMVYHDAQMVSREPVKRLLLTWSDRGIDGPRPAHQSERPAADRGPVMRLIDETERRARYHRAVILTVPRGRAKAQALAADLASHVDLIDIRDVALEDPSD